jgi:hypothetical protein
VWSGFKSKPSPEFIVAKTNLLTIMVLFEDSCCSRTNVWA